MTDKLLTAKRIIRGKQRIAVSEALRVPRTGKQILEYAKRQAPTISYQDLRHILRGFQQDGYASCLNPENQTGRLYVLSSELDKHLLSLPEIELHAKLRRAKARLAVLEELTTLRLDERPLTASQIRKNLLESYPMGLNHVLAALKFLEAHNLVEVIEFTNKRSLKIYAATRLGADTIAKIVESKVR